MSTPVRTISRTLQALQGTYGTFTFNTTTGAWTYALNQALADPLTQGQAVTDTLTVTSADGTASYNIVVNITGTNDAAVLSADVRNLTEGDTVAAISTSGTLTISDVDSSETFVAQVGTSGTYGTFDIDSAGAWTYTASSAHDEFVAGQHYIETFDVVSADGTHTTVHIDILGTNDAAVITGTATDSVTEASGVANGTPGDATASGDLDATDVDSSALFTVQSGVAKSYGTFSIDASGAWSYTLDDDNLDVQALNTGGTLHELVTVTTADGTEQVIDVTINGANDAAVITGTATDSVTEASGVANGTPGDATASGDLDATDVDSSALFTVQSGVAKSYGTFSIDASGAWSYTLDDDNLDVQALNTGGTLHELVTVTTADGTEQVIDVTINGANDAAVITGTATNSVTEASGVANGTPGDATASGDLDATDVDSSALFTVQSGVAKSYGTFSIDASGAWSYTLDDDNLDVQALNTGGTLHELVTVTTADGTEQVIDVTINGANDAAVITGTATDSVTEASGVANGTPGDATASGDLDATDVDSSALFTVQSGVAKSYGTFSIDASGAWSYTLDDDNLDVQALNTGGTLHELVTVTTADGTEQVIDVTINGANDAAVITGTATDSVTEASGVANGTPGDATASGDLDATDVDSSALFTVQSGVAKSYGTFSIDASGAWSYTLDDDNLDVQALNTGGTLHELVTVTTADGTEQVIDVTINGANDAAVITGTATDSVTEASGVANGTPGDATASGDLDATDVDSSALFTVQSGVAKSYGTFSIDASGAWSYTLDDDNLDVQALNTGGTLHELVTVTTADGTEQVIDVTINGANDAAVITGTATVGDRGRRRCQRHARRRDGHRRPGCDRRRQLGAVRGADRRGQELRHLLDRCDRRMELHARRRQPGGAGAQRRRHAARAGDGHDRRRHRAGDRRHHQRRQRRGGDHRHGDGLGDRGVRRRQRHARRRDGLRRPGCDRRRQLGDVYRADRRGQELRHLLDRCERCLELHARRRQRWMCRRSTAGGTLHELVTVSTADGTEQVIDITINGANDAAVITGTATGRGDRGRRRRQRHARRRDGLRRSGCDRRRQPRRRSPCRPAWPRATARSRSMRRGAWSYTLDDANAAVQALNTGRARCTSW